jgi:hypothetical protein
MANNRWGDLEFLAFIGLCACIFLVAQIAYAENSAPYIGIVIGLIIFYFLGKQR